MDKKLHQAIIEDDDLTLTEKIDAVFAALPPETDAQKVAREAEIEEEFYIESARDVLGGVSGIVYKWLYATKQAHGEDSAEYQNLTAETASIRKKLRNYSEDITHPNVRAALPSLREIWRANRGWDYNDQGGISKTDKRPDRNTLSALQRATSFNL